MIEHYDLYVRAMADLENARRRSSEELVKTRKFAIEKFAENLLPVVDSLEKALEATAAPEGVKPGMVVQVFQRGWNIAGRVLRPAMVSVAQG